MEINSATLRYTCTECKTTWSRNYLTGWNDAYQERHEMIESVVAKIGERKTVHEWMNQIGIPDTEECGAPMCLLRRLAVALGIQPHCVDGSINDDAEAVAALLKMRRGMRTTKASYGGRKRHDNHK